MVYVIVAIIALLAIYFLFLRKSEAPAPSELPTARKPSEAPKQPSPKEPSARPAPEAEAAAPQAPRAPSTQTAPDEAAAVPPPPPSARGRPLLSRRADVESLRRGLARDRAA